MKQQLNQLMAQDREPLGDSILTFQEYILSSGRPLTVTESPEVLMEENKVTDPYTPLALLKGTMDLKQVTEARTIEEARAYVAWWDVLVNRNYHWRMSLNSLDGEGRTIADPSVSIGDDVTFLFSSSQELPRTLLRHPRFPFPRSEPLWTGSEKTLYLQTESAGILNVPDSSKAYAAQLIQKASSIPVDGTTGYWAYSLLEKAVALDPLNNRAHLGLCELVVKSITEWGLPAGNDLTDRFKLHHHSGMAIARTREHDESLYRLGNLVFDLSPELAYVLLKPLHTQHRGGPEKQHFNERTKALVERVQQLDNSRLTYHFSMFPY